MYGVLDRFEGDFAVIQTDQGEIRNIKKILLPKEAKEGDVIDMEKLTIDENETKRRQKAISDLAYKLFND